MKFDGVRLTIPAGTVVRLNGDSVVLRQDEDFELETSQLRALDENIGLSEPDPPRLQYCWDKRAKQ